MSLGEFRKLTENLPDDTHLLMDLGELEFHEIYVREILPPTLKQPRAVWLETGQQWNSELDMDARIDEYLGIR